MGVILSRALALAIAADSDIEAGNPILAWHNVVAASTIVADEETATDPGIHLANPNTSLYWSGETASEQYLTITIPSGVEPNYVGIERHNYGTAQIAVSIEALAPESETWVEVVEEFLPGDDSTLLLRFTGQPAEKIRIRMQAGSEAPSAAVVYCGVAVRMPQGVEIGYAPLNLAIRTRVSTGTSESGNFLSRTVLGVHAESPADFSKVSASWYRANIIPFTKFARENPFFFAWEPATYPTDVGFAWLTADPIPTLPDESGMMAFSLPMRATAI